jgi:hypothetical protein
MHIGFDISQTGAGKAGCGFFAHALIDTMLAAAPEHRYALYPSFGDFYFDRACRCRSPYRGRDVAYGPRHLTRAAATAFWNAPRRRVAPGRPRRRAQANNYWCPTAFAASRVVYTCYDLSFAVDPSWTTEANRVGCFEGVFRAAASADRIVAISHASRDHYLSVFPHFPAERIRVIHPCSRFDGTARGRAAGRACATSQRRVLAMRGDDRAAQEPGAPCRGVRALPRPGRGPRCPSSSPAARAGSWRASARGSSRWALPTRCS